MNTHTPGPWVVESLPDEGPSIHTGGSGIARRIAGVDVGGWKRTTLADAEANARLIAAAPDLLEALQAIAHFIHTTSAAEGGASKYSANVVAADMVRAAIAKATGATS